MKRKSQFVFFAVAFLLGIASAGVGSAAAEETPETWFQNGKNTVKEAKSLKKNTRKAKNVILFIGDGMGVSTVTAARILEGQMNGGNGEEHSLSFEKFPYLALAKTYNTNQQTPDSAGTMTAMMTGIKTKAGIIGVNQNTIRSDCTSSLGNELTTFLEEAEMAGRSTGVVTTARLTHATPAATYAHIPERNWEDDDDINGAGQGGLGCKDIASQLVDFPYGDGIEVAMGGGTSAKQPIPIQRTPDSSETGPTGGP